MTPSPRLGTNRRRQWRRPLVVLVVVAVVLCACAVGWVRRFGVPLTEGGGDIFGFVVENHLDRPLIVEVDRGRGPVTYDVLRTNSVPIPLNRVCGPPLRLVAREVAGPEVARLDDPLCAPRTWVIAADGSTELLPTRRWPYPG
ncbi:hypothetical protein [Micromonospora vulcania]|uniref:NusG domain-containing protein n=1 Tax=Micromonospora vulcania TaxID=1441873 RepID=A0ABW1HDU4_9ACTN